MKTLLTLLAILLLLLALASFWGNIQFLMKGEGLPEEPAVRQGYIVGMFTVPTALLLGAVACGTLAVRRRRSN